MKDNVKKYGLPGVISALFLILYFYFAIPAINLRAIGFYVMLFLTAFVYVLSYLLLNDRSFFVKLGVGFKGYAQKQIAKEDPEKFKNAYIVGEDKINIPKWVKKTLIILGCVIGFVLLLAFFTSSKLFRAKSYRQMLEVTESDFEKDIAEIPFNQIPVVDKDTAARLGNRKIGEVVELVSQFNVSDYYSQINYNGEPYRVTPLEYAGILKWFSNKDKGIPYYVSINMATQETKLVELPDGMKYSPSEYFSRDLERYIRFKYPTKMFENLSFEVDDNDAPYWVMSYYKYTFGLFGGKDIAGVILVNAVTGETKDYPIDEVPQWIDLAYSPELIVEQADNWGSYKNGFFNSIFVQKNVVVTTEGYNYIALDDDVWLYTGITSVVSDESNIGFILVNMRTKEARTYMINGAEEYSAMESAQGQIQEKSYTATFPILVNVADRPTYFISLKDNAGLVKSYAFVSVAEYQTVGVGDTIEGAKSEYLRLLGVSDAPTDTEQKDEIIGEISRIATAIVGGNSKYYITLSGSGEIIIIDISVSDILPYLVPGDKIKIGFNLNGQPIEVVYSE